MSNYLEIINKVRPKMEESFIFLQKDLKEMRTAKANPTLVENLIVQHYGTETPVKHIASIAVSQERTLVIQPWDSSYLKPIEKAILVSNLGLLPIIEGKIVRVQLPALTEEYRQNLLKLLSEKIEKTKITFRQHREKVWREIQIMAQNGEIGEDDKFRAKDNLQDIINEYQDRVGKLEADKKKEILTV
jgi:ribosome recycling factor